MLKIRYLDPPSGEPLPFFDARDTIALEAMKVILNAHPKVDKETVARWCYELADAMIKRSEKP